MGTRKIRTLIKSDHALGKDMFVLGRIMGAMAAMCKQNPAKGVEFGRGLSKAGHIIMVETTDRKYRAFVNVIENWYPDLCVFDYSDK